MANVTTTSPDDPGENNDSPGSFLEHMLGSDTAETPPGDQPATPPKPTADGASGGGPPAEPPPGIQSSPEQPGPSFSNDSPFGHPWTGGRISDEDFGEADLMDLGDQAVRVEKSEGYWDFLDYPDPEEEQADLGLKVVNKKHQTKLINDFKIFHNRNPLVYRLLKSYARMWRKKHPNWRVGIGMIYELLRWEVAMTTVDTTSAEPKKLSNNHRAYYARLIMAKEPDLKDIFVLKPTNAERDGVAARRAEEKQRKTEARNKLKAAATLIREHKAEIALAEREHKEKVASARKAADVQNRANNKEYRAKIAEYRQARLDYSRAKSLWEKRQKAGTLTAEDVQPTIPSILIEPEPVRPALMEPEPVEPLALPGSEPTVSIEESSVVVDGEQGTAPATGKATPAGDPAPAADGEEEEHPFITGRADVAGVTDTPRKEDGTKDGKPTQGSLFD